MPSPTATPCPRCRARGCRRRRGRCACAPSRPSRVSRPSRPRPDHCPHPTPAGRRSHVADKDITRRPTREVGAPAAPAPGYQPLRPAKKGIGQALAPVAGFGVTISSMFKPTVTEQYPFEKTPTKPRFHGRHKLNRYADGLEKCIGCELCAWACPADAIYVEGADNTPDAQYSPGERYGRVYQINYLRCIFCGLCIEACPTRALTMTNVYELVSDSRSALIFEKDQLLAPVQEDMVAPPHPMAAGMQERDYYLGKVAKATPEQRAWADAREAEIASTDGGAR